MKSKRIHDYPFEFSPKLIRFLGEELIHDKKIAIAELVKNAYDADASKVTLTIKDKKIIIEDDGKGMNAHIIKEYWLKPGNSPKPDEIERTPKFKRLPIGEKGIGRLGVHKLGDKITVISRQAGSDEVLFKIDWEKFEEAKNLKDLEPIQVIENPEGDCFKNNSTGTKLIIENLKEPMEDKDIKLLKNDLIKILPPFESSIDKEFVINLVTQYGLFEEENQLSLDDITKSSLFYFKIVFEKGEIKSFKYEFRSPNNQKIESRKLELENIKDDLESFKEKYLKQIETDEEEIISLEKNDVGPIIFQGYIFDSKFSGLFGYPHPTITKDYLQSNGGIRVYRDKMRVYNYGEEGRDNDILNLDRKRAKKIGNNIGYNQILASIELDIEKSKEYLVEKTNREGFIHNSAFLYLQQALDFCMEVVLYYRKMDRTNMKPLFGKEYDRADIGTKVEKIIRMVNKLDISDKEKENINNSLEDFSEEFNHIKNVFLTASNTGLNMTFIIHEMDKIIDYIEKKIKEKNIVNINQGFIHLKKTIVAYKETIRLDKEALKISIRKVIKQAIFNAQYRFDYHKIKILKDFRADLSITEKKGLIIGVLMNLFDNSIYWLDHYKVSEKKIYIKAYEDEEFIVLLVADNGKGFNISFDAALGPFISGRFNDSSMGIGLHLAEQVMNAHQGTIEQGNWQEENLPDDFSQGAIIKLKFRKELV